MILVVSHPGDDHASAVLAALEQMGHVAVVLNTAEFPRSMSIIQTFGNARATFAFSRSDLTIDLEECGAAWWRRPQPFALDPGLQTETVSFTYSECHEAVAGMWAALELSWVNPPGLDEAAHHKPYQLTVASKAGLPIPPTLITNDPVAARRFVAERGPSRTVYKTFLASEEHWRETRLLKPEELELLDRVRLAPVIFQEYVPAVADLRVIVMGDRMFAAAISPAPGGYTVDYRMDIEGAHFEPTSLSEETERGIRDLMERLGLIYGAVDLRRTPEGREIFLEINPAGEWRFVEEHTGQPMTEAMAELLISLDTN